MVIVDVRQGRSDYRKDDKVDPEEVSKSQHHLYPSGLMLFGEPQERESSMPVS